MKTCYVDTEYRAIVDLVRPGELTPNWTITRINVPGIHRGEGVGAALLKQVLDDADAEGVTLQLEVFASGDLGFDELVAWYERNGFGFNSLGYMERKPKPKATGEPQ